MKRPLLPLLMASAAWVLGACGDDGLCELNNPDKACAEGLVCETVQGQAQARCFTPVQVQGRVFDLASKAGISGAVVSAVDSDGAPVGAQTTSTADGSYALTIPSVRSDEAGTPIGQRMTLRAAARDFEPFPSGIRVALPVNTEGASRPADQEQAPFALKSELTDVGLNAVAAERKGLPSIEGTVEGTDGRGVLVVAETSSGTATTGYSAVADASGKFRIFNVPQGSYSVQAYLREANYTAANVVVEAGKDVTGVTLQRSAAPAGELSGSVSIVATGGGLATSIVMVVESTFNSALARGEVPAGLRSPEPGTAPNITGAFKITGVPDGRYVVLAAFENDGLVRDPDPNIAGTQLQRVTVTNGVASLQPAFKVTGAVALVGPGAGDGIEEVQGTPKFVWQPYSSTQHYDVVVFDAQGNKVWETRVAAVTGANNELAYAGPALKPGGVYQWRVTALSRDLAPKSMSEDLKGLFRVL